MKTLILCIAAANALKINGIEKDDLMQNQPSHFRKQWPQGVVDNSHGDSEIIDMFNESLPRKKVKTVVRETYPWDFDDDVKTTNASMGQAEKVTGSKLSMAGVVNGGMDMIFTYDNTKRVFERNTPHGNTWHGDNDE